MVNFENLEERDRLRQGLLEGVPAQLWRLVLGSRHRLLMLDYDGTLAPLVIQRNEAHPLPRSLELLRQISKSAHTTVAIVSGRPLSELESLIGPLPAIFVGEHGWERRAPNGEVIRRPLEPSVAKTIDSAEQASREAGWGEYVERKHSGVVLHTRALPEKVALDLTARCIRAWEPLTAGARVALDTMHGGLELRAHEFNKGTVVLSLLSQTDRGTLGVFVGDDVTDEDAFQVVRDNGFGIRVGDDDLPSIAQGRLDSCEAVSAFLEEWVRVTSGPNIPES